VELLEGDAADAILLRFLATDLLDVLASATSPASLRASLRAFTTDQSG